MNVCGKDQPATAHTSFKCAPFDKACEAATLRVEWGLIVKQYGMSHRQVNLHLKTNAILVCLEAVEPWLHPPKADKELIGLTPI